MPAPHSLAASANLKDLVHVVTADGGDGEEVAAVVKLMPEDAAVAYAVADVGAEVVGALLAAEGGVEGGVDGKLDEIPGVGVDVGFLQPDGDGSAVDEEVSGVTAEVDDVDVAYCGVHCGAPIRSSPQAVCGADLPLGHRVRESGGCLSTLSKAISRRYLVIVSPTLTPTRQLCLPSPARFTTTPSPATPESYRLHPVHRLPLPHQHQDHQRHVERDDEPTDNPRDSAQ